MKVLHFLHFWHILYTILEKIVDLSFPDCFGAVNAVLSYMEPNAEEKTIRLIDNYLNFAAKPEVKGGEWFVRSWPLY